MFKLLNLHPKLYPIAKIDIIVCYIQCIHVQTIFKQFIELKWVKIMSSRGLFCHLSHYIMLRLTLIGNTKGINKV